MEPGVTQIVIPLAYDDAEMRGATADHPKWGAAWRQRDAFRKVLAENNVNLITSREVGKLIAR
jgi:hypothetical protein